ncbi:MAG: penicillin-binding protein 2 [Lentisphaerae bacterium]|nr:penicillin-binding protein 2 [Lentisphaerota bacterium]
MADDEVVIPGGYACLVVASVFAAGLLALAVRLKAVQIDSVATLAYSGEKQSVRLVRTDGIRGRIIASGGEVLADNRPVRSIVLDAASFQKRSWGATATNIMESIARACEIVGRPSSLSERDIARHLHQRLARPLSVLRDLTDDEVARFSERSDELPGFTCIETLDRWYPRGSLAAHILGYVGRDRVEGGGGDEKINYRDFGMHGRSGLEIFYDSFLRGVPGEKKLIVDARGFACREMTTVEPKPGPDLVLSLDVDLQDEAERQLAGVRGAAVAIDPLNGGILAIASSPGFNPNDFVPTLRADLYESLSKDPAKPLLNRAVTGSYAPGSTFKPITALAALAAGVSPYEEHECVGYFKLGGMRIRCSRTWGHGYLDMPHALKESCNPFFCDVSLRVGTNGLVAAAKKFGLGSRTGIDLPGETAGVVPDAAWKREHWHEPWYPGDLPQMSIGQGMLLATPLQMARVAAALGTGYLVTPHVKADAPSAKLPIPWPKDDIDHVRRGMRLVVTEGTGRRGASNLNAYVLGKTGTAEVGAGASRRKNTWFIAYAEPCDFAQNGETPLRRKDKTGSVAVAMVVENGESGGGTTAPRVREILRRRFGER